MVVRLLARVRVVMSPQLPRPMRADTLRASSLALTPSLSLQPDLTPESLVHPRASRQPLCTPEPSLVGEMGLPTRKDTKAPWWEARTQADRYELGS